MSLILPRRNFLKSLSGAAVVSAMPSIVKGQSKRIAVFQEQGFPRIQTTDFQLNFEVTFLSEQDLIARLNVRDFDLFINPYGSAFPKRAWSAILRYLQAGGNWLNCGGVPLSRPVVRTAYGWAAEPYQAAYHKRLGITHFFPVDAAKISKYESPHPQLVDSFQAKEIYELYVRLSSTNTEPDEAGSDGPHEGGVQSLLFGLNGDGRSIAAPVIQIDRWQAEFVNGRWVLANFNGSLTANALKLLAEIAMRGAARFRVRSEFACYRAGEVPVVPVERNCNFEVRDPSGQVVGTDLTRIVSPGLYEIHASCGELEDKSGFWVYDKELIKRGKALTVDNHLFYRDGRVFPVTGTTYMASDVHRRFLFEPNPLVWDRDFAEMKRAGVNMVRTGIWTGWKRYMPEPGKVNEVTVRAFDAFLLTAHKYDIPVIFTFFAFLPETWGGVNAYLDPRAVKAQQQFISAFAERCAGVDDVMWDFINEPSFCSPKYLWSCRPNYDEFEKAAWKDWLTNRYPANNDEERRAHLQQLWRTTADDVLELPKLQDFDSVHLIDERQPLKTLDYRLFAQDMFIRWVQQMTTAVRSNGNKQQLITVGQDEAGLGDSPNMQFFAPHTDFTSLHNWWNNDDLVWDSVLAKVPSKASLVEETGVMFYERADGDEPWRSEQEVSNLLERKMAISFATDGAGFIEWIWNTNPYMNSTNEVGIGFHRVDGTAKPELEPFLAIAKFMNEHGHLFQERQPEPVVMVIPHSQMFSPRGFAHEATRKCVRAMYYHCGVPMQAISEYTLADYSGPAKLIVVPAPGVLTPKCWNALRARAREGATVAISGVIDADDYEPVTQTNPITIGAQNYLVRYEGEKIQRIEKANFGGIKNTSFGAGRLIQSPLPLELGDSMAALVAFYRMALAQAGVAPIFTAMPRTPTVLVLPSVFRDVVLYTFVSETDRDTKLQVTDSQTKTRFTVNVPAGRTAMKIVNRRTGRSVSTGSLAHSPKQWRLVWADEFNYRGLPDPAKWNYDVGGHGWGNKELQYYTERRKENARVENGRLIIEARRENWNEREYTSARLISKGKGDWTYGRFEVKAKLPTGRGVWPAIWMLPSVQTYGNWPNGGEIDIMEQVGFDPQVVHASIHTKAYYHSIGTQKTAKIDVPNATTGFNVYAVEWTPQEIRAYVNQQHYFTFKNERLTNPAADFHQWPLDQPFHLLLNIAVGGTWGGQQGVDETIWPQRMEVDYVRVYQLY